MNTIILETAEDRRRYGALTQCAVADGKGREALTHVLFAGDAAYATDTVVAATIPHPWGPIDLAPADLDGDEDARVVVPARRLRDALALAQGSEIVRLRFDAGALHVVIGDDPLPLGDEYLPTEVQIPYGDAYDYPATATLERLLDGTGVEPDDRVVTALGINASSLARIARLVPRADDSSPDLVTVHPRGPFRPVEVRNANTGARLGVIGPIRHLSADDLPTRPETADA